MLSVASVTCFYTAYSPFQTTDVVQERRANAARGYQPENLPITSARQAFSPFRFRGQARSGARISVKKSNSRYKVGCSRHC